MLFTSYPAAWRELADITKATHRKYCDMHGYDYFADCSETKMVARSPFVDRPHPEGFIPLRYFIKFQLLEHFLDKDACGMDYETAAWVDADCLVTNYNRPLADWPGEIVTAADINAVHPTVIIVRKSTRTRRFIWACNNAGRTLFQHHEWCDNECLRYFDAALYKGIVTYYPAQDMCAQTPGLYPIPPDLRAEDEWTRQSWMLHLSALSLPERIERAKSAVQELHLL